MSQERKILLQDIIFDVHSGPVGIAMSGGADSAILAYILMKEKTDGPIHFFTYSQKDKSEVAKTHSIKVIEKLKELTGRTDVFHHIETVENYDRNDFFLYMTEQVDNKLINIMYMGTTRPPSDEELTEFKNKLDPKTYARRKQGIRYRFYANEDKTYDPFLGITKKKIKELYDEYEVIESLYPLTRSCESRKVFDKHCDECWWCEERLWAFGKHS